MEFTWRSLSRRPRSKDLGSYQTVEMLVEKSRERDLGIGTAVEDEPDVDTCGRSIPKDLGDRLGFVGGETDES